eukprot:jgi/Mesvir1/19818/Mv13108-RA.1
MTKGSDAMASSFFRTTSWPIDKKVSVSEETARRLLTKPETVARSLPTESEARAACIFGAFVRSGRVSFDGWECMSPTMVFFETLGRFALQTGASDEKSEELIRDFNKHSDFWRCVMDHYSPPEFRIEGQLHKNTMAHMNVSLNDSKEPVLVDPDSCRGLTIVKEMPERCVFYQVFMHVNTLLFQDLKDQVPDFHTDMEDLEDSEPRNAYSRNWPGYFWFRGVRSVVSDEKMVQDFDWRDAHPEWHKEAIRDITHSFHFVRYPQCMLDWFTKYRQEISDKLS